jgi:hypothetical protein
LQQLAADGCTLFIAYFKLFNLVSMVQMMPNAALIQAMVLAAEPYPAQVGFYVVSLLVKQASEKSGKRFLGSDLQQKEVKVLVSQSLTEQLNLTAGQQLSGEIKKVSPVMWRAIEESWQPAANKRSATKPPKKR